MIPISWFHRVLWTHRRGNPCTQQNPLTRPLLSTHEHCDGTRDVYHAAQSLASYEDVQALGKTSGDVAVGYDAREECTECDEERAGEQVGLLQKF